MLPNKFAPWELVCYYCRKWSSLGEFDLLLNNLREKVHVKMGQKTEAIIGIMDRDIPKIIKFKATNSLRVSCLFCIFKHSPQKTV